jgi:glutathione S-transferase
VKATLYWTPISHPCQAARKMLDLKGVDYKLVHVLPLSQRVHLRIARFRGGTVPAVKLDGERVQGSKQIARVLDRRCPQPALFPADPSFRLRVEQAESWGERELQPIPRRLARYGAARSVELRRWGLKDLSIPGVDLAARFSAPLVGYYAKTVEPDGRRGDETGVRADLAALPALLDRADELVADGTLTTDPPNAASLQILSTVRTLRAFTDLRELVGDRPSALAADKVGFSPRELRPVPPFLPAQWLPTRA